jgi:hypothetical protein
VLLSHRYTDIPIGGARLVLHRAISPRLLVRYVQMSGVVQDERFTRMAVGIDSEKPRQRLTIALEGKFRDFLAYEELAVEPGSAIFIPESAASNSRCAGAALELEWDSDGPEGSGVESPARLRLGHRAHQVAAGFAHQLACASSGDAVQTHLLDLLGALRAEGVPLRSERLLVSPNTLVRDQALMNEVDAALSNLCSAPMLVDLEVRTGMARRSLTRNIRLLHERYALLGRGEGQWRAMRDTHRLVIASIVSSHRDVAPRTLAKLVGYGSVEALDHAFRNASLRSPAELGRAVRAG